MKYLTLLCLITFLYVGCKHDHKHSHGHDHESEAINMPPLYDTVMFIHDAVMPETATIHKIRKALKETNTDGERAPILDQIKYLDDAEEAMMAWMAEFKVPEEQVQQIPYLEIEKVKIQKVSDLMYDAIKKGQSMLDSLQQNQK